MKKIAGADRGLNPANPDNFVMPARMQRLLGRDDGEAVRLYRVSFDVGSRTNWHTHDGIQVLFGLAGSCVVATRDGDRATLEVGDVVIVEAGEEHWHGAAPDGRGEHLAINVGSDTEWLDSSAGA